MHGELDLKLKTGSPTGPLEEKDMFPGRRILHEEKGKMTLSMNNLRNVSETSGEDSENGMPIKKLKSIDQAPLYKGEGSGSGLCQCNFDDKPADQVPLAMDEESNAFGGFNGEFEALMGMEVPFVMGPGSNYGAFGSDNAIQPMGGAEFSVGTDGLTSQWNYPMQGYNAMQFFQKPTDLAMKKKRRMIKNRESAARSRARRQAYASQLQYDVSRLKTENEYLVNKFDNSCLYVDREDDDMEKTGSVRSALRRTLSSPI